MALSLPKIPLPPVIQAGFEAILAAIHAREAALVKAGEALYPGTGAALQHVADALDPELVAALDAAMITTKAGIELGEALRTLHAFAKPDPTDAG